MENRLPSFAFVSVLALAASAGIPGAADPPPLMNYQGVLRDSMGVPLNGSYDIVFALFDAESGGQELLLDEHTGATVSAVQVTNGLFSVAIGSGTLVDGSGPGTYTALAPVFSDFSGVWLEIRVSTETLSPRTRFVSAPFALNAGAVDGLDGSLLLNTTSTAQWKQGRLDITASGSTSTLGFANSGLHTYGALTGARALNAYGHSAYLARRYGSGSAGYGIEATGTFDGAQGGGGIFTDTTTSATALLASRNAGVDASGPQVGGHFARTGTSAQAWLAGGDLANFAWGIVAEGAPNSAAGGGGGLFRDTVSGTSATLASGNVAVGGNASFIGGFFTNSQSNSSAGLATPVYGASGIGPTAGAWFSNSTGGSQAYIGYRMGSGENWGINARGDWTAGTGTGGGGYFLDGATGATAEVASGSLGISGRGALAGGYFQNQNTGAQAWVAGGSGVAPGWGIESYGAFNISYGWGGGGYFADTFYGSHASVGSWDIAVDAWGPLAGGRFVDSTTGNYVNAGADIFKVQGVGTMAFVQNHPTDKDHVIVYAAPEGPESATYTRGSARLKGGVAHIPLDPTFALVTNPDIGLTAHITPRGKGAGLYVDSVTSETLVVRSDDPGAGDTMLDYLVYGLRIGFEEVPVLQEKKAEARIPSMARQRDLLSRRPDLAASTPSTRFARMHDEMGIAAPLDRRASQALREAVQEYDAAVHGPLELPSASQSARRSGPHPLAPRAPSVEEPSTDPVASPAPEAPGLREAAPAGPLVPQGSTRMEISDAVSPGEVVVLDDGAPGRVRAGARAGDPAVAGVVADGEAGPGLAFIVTSGVILCKVDAGYGAIRTGDLLTLSETEGHAMRVLDPVPGTILGKAIDPLDAGTGTIRILVTLR